MKVVDEPRQIAKQIRAKLPNKFNKYFVYQINTLYLQQNKSYGIIETESPINYSKTNWKLWGLC